MTETIQRAVRAVAVMEAAKGVLALLLASGLLMLMREDLHALALMLVKHAHLNPASSFSRTFVETASGLRGQKLLWIAAAVMAYATLRFVEAWGLFGNRAWAEVLGAVSAGVYIPFEVAELVHAPGWPGALLLLVNCIVVYVMVDALRQRRALAPG